MLDRTLFAAGTLFFVATLAGCASGGVAPDEVVVGTVLGTDAVIGSVSDGETITFYVCGGPTTFGTMTRWFSGPADASGATSLDEDGWRVESDPGGHSGRVVPPQGSPLPFVAHPARPGTPEGLFAVEDEGCRTGAVVLELPGAARPSVQGAWCGSGGRFEQVIPILPGSLSSRGIAVRVDVGGLRRDLYVEPFSLRSP